MPVDTGVTEAKVLLSRGEIAAAVALLDHILAEDPRHLDALLLRAGLHLEAREESEALALSYRAAEAWPRSSEALDALARCLHVLGRNEEALAAAQRAKAVLREGDNFRHAGSVYLTLVWCLRDARRFREALEAAEEGLSVAPDAVLAQWASTVEEEFAASQKEEC